MRNVIVEAMRAKRAAYFSFAAIILLGAASPAWADLVPNPGGTTVTTSSTTATINYVGTPVTDRVDDYSTVLNVFLNGIAISSQTYADGFSDPAVQAAVLAADATLNGDGATFGAPDQIGLMTTLQSSSVASSMINYTCLTVPSADANGTVNATLVNTFGPATINVGQCDTDTFDVNDGQEDTNFNRDFVYTVPYDITTTDTYLTSATYEIDGLTAQVAPPPPVGVPEPGTLAMFGAALAGLATMRRRGSVSRRTAHA